MPKDKVAQLESWDDADELTQLKEEIKKLLKTEEAEIKRLDKNARCIRRTKVFGTSDFHNLQDIMEERTAAIARAYSYTRVLQRCAAVRFPNATPPITTPPVEALNIIAKFRKPY